MKRLFIYFLFLIILGCQLLYSQNKDRAIDNKPNVILIYTDDQGAIDLNCYGANDIYSPNFDKLAKEGTRFTQAYVAAPVCAPSRAALLTGKYPQNANVTGNTSAAIGSDGMPNEQYTLAELFKDNGYDTAHIGKWHLGMSKKTGPNAQGFDYSFGHLRGCIDNYSHYFYWDGPNTHDLYENGKEVFFDGQYFPDLASNKAIDYVEKHKDKPFFMFYAINMPHYPYQPTKKWRDYYKDIPKPRGDYAAFISTIDERVGLLMNKLDELGIRENTIIVYQSDNGYSTEARAFGGGGNSGPYRGAKNSLFEGGIRLPTIISWKGHLPENKVNNQFLMNLDWMPTLASLCNIKNIPQKIDGINMSGMIKNTKVKSPRTKAFWKYGNQWVVRKGKWKLIAFPKDTSHKGKIDLEKDALFLSDLESDVSEMVNLANKYPEIVKELINDFLEWEHGYQRDIPKKMKVINHLGLKGCITSTKKLHSKYQNINVLLDGKRGYADFSTGQWIGQNGKELEFIIEMKEKKEINNITLGYLQSTGNWVFAPKYFEASFSDNGVIFNHLTRSETPKRILEKGNFTDKISIKVNQKSKFIKINIKGAGMIPKNYSGEGSEGWFFIDEIVIK